MNKDSYVETLRQRHAELDSRIREEEAHHVYDSIAITRLKTEKLHIKEEIDRLTH